MTTVVFDRLVSSGSLIFDRFIDVTASPTAPVVTSVSAVQDGAAITIGGSFDVSGNSVFLRRADDADGDIQISISTENATTIVTQALSARYWYLTRTNVLTVRNATGAISNETTVVIAPQATERTFAVTQEFLGSPSSRIESDPPLVLGDEVRIRNVVGSTLADVNVTGQAAFDVASAATALDAAVFDGDELGSYATQTLVNLVTTLNPPNVVGLDKNVALSAIQSVGLAGSIVSTVASQTVARDVVISQFPTAATSVFLGDTIELTVSSGLPQVQAPDVKTLSLDDAITQLTAKGILAQPIFYVAGVRNLIVVNQTIAPGTLVDVGSSIGLSVSIAIAPNTAIGSIFLSQDEPVPSNAVFRHGAAFAQTGERYIALWPTDGEVFHLGSFAYREDGALIVVSGQVSYVRPEGVGTTEKGEVISAVVEPVYFHNGWALLEDGTVCFTDLSGVTPGSGDGSWGDAWGDSWGDSWG